MDHGLNGSSRILATVLYGFKLIWVGLKALKLKQKFSSKLSHRLHRGHR